MGTVVELRRDAWNWGKGDALKLRHIGLPQVGSKLRWTLAEQAWELLAKQGVGDLPQARVHFLAAYCEGVGQVYPA